MQRRIALLTSLPIEKLDRLSLQREARRIASLTEGVETKADGLTWWRLPYVPPAAESPSATAALLLCHVGSGIMAERLSGEARAWRCSPMLSPRGFALYVLITVLPPSRRRTSIPSSQSAAVANKRNTRPSSRGAHLPLQWLGAVVGVWLAHAMFELPLLQVGTQVRARTGTMVKQKALAPPGLLLVIAGAAAATRADKWLLLVGGLYQPRRTGSRPQRRSPILPSRWPAR